MHLEYTSANGHFRTEIVRLFCYTAFNMRNFCFTCNSSSCIIHIITSHVQAGCSATVCMITFNPKTMPMNHELPRILAMQVPWTIRKITKRSSERDNVSECLIQETHVTKDLF